MTPPDDIDVRARLDRAAAIVERIETLERELDAAFIMKRVIPQPPDSFFRRDSILPPPLQSRPRPSITPPPVETGPEPRARQRAGSTEELARIVSDNLRIERERKGVTQQELADRTGIRRPNIARLEKGTSLPNLATLFRVAEGLAADLPGLLSREPPRTK